ncbi:hypothetical protein MnTg02_01291 [bacterium MnTg02]|nr:hypothetical protein MnTg02_01291 [bacterium MnTg02]
MEMRDDEQLQSVVFFLCDHLDSIVDESDQIVALSYSSAPISTDMSSENVLKRLDEFHSFLDQIKTHELLLVTKLTQARHWSFHLRDLDHRFRPIIDLFTVATDICDNMGNVLGPDDDAVFNGAGQPQHFIESRQLLTETLEMDNPPVRIAVNDSFLLGGRIRLLELVRVCASFRKSLETRYGLAGFEPIGSAPAQESEDDSTAADRSIIEN